MTLLEPTDCTELATKIKAWGKAVGFQQVGITTPHLTIAKERLQAWLGNGWHGSMDYMARHERKRTEPAELVPETIRIISVRMDYLP